MRCYLTSLNPSLVSFFLFFGGGGLRRFQLRCHLTSLYPSLLWEGVFIRKILVSAKFVSAILGPETAAPILWAPRISAFFLQENLHVHKIPRFLGGGVFGFGGGGKCRFYFYGRGDFSEFSFLACFLVRFCLGCLGKGGALSNLSFLLVCVAFGGAGGLGFSPWRQAFCWMLGVCLVFVVGVVGIVGGRSLLFYWWLLLFLLLRLLFWFYCC